MHLSEIYHEVPADELVRLGVIDTMRTPADGTDRNTHIHWNGVTLAVAAGFDTLSEGNEPQHRIIVKETDAQGHSQGFSTEELPDGRILVATVSGWHPEGRALLSTEQSAAFKQLVDVSIAAGSLY